MSLTQLLTMAHIKSEGDPDAAWQSYSLQPELPYAPYPPAPPKTYRPMDMSEHARRPQQSHHHNSSNTSNPTPLDPSSPGLSSSQSFSSLKRAYTDDAYEPLQEFREEGPESTKPTISQDHRLLAFSRRGPDAHTVIDRRGIVQTLELAAQIHGMFFLSEMATSSRDGLLVQPELTCYRRNLFQISGSVTAPRGPMSIMSEHGERTPITALEVQIAATESVDAHPVKLIVIPWKTPPPNSPEVQPGQEQEPTPIPLLPLDEPTASMEGGGDFIVYPIAYRRLQFRIATANNGRRRELQQHFTLHLNLVATLASGARLTLCETVTAPIVVRGRSPRNFQARKEIPLVGSSTSRGPAPELVPTGQAVKPVPATKRDMEMPRSFNFDPTGLPASPMMLRHSTYPPWNPHQAQQHAPSHPPSERGTAPASPSYPSPSLSNHSHGLESYLPGDIPNSLPVSGGPIRHPQYAYTSAPSQSQSPTIGSMTSAASASGNPSTLPMRFLDSNPRPAKSPRHAADSGQFADYATGRPYAGYSAGPEDGSRGFYPSPLNMHAWSAADTTAYGSVVGPADLQSGGYTEYHPDGSNVGSIPQGTYTWGSV